MSDLIPWKDQAIQKIKQDMDELFTYFMQDFSQPHYHGLCINHPRITTFEDRNTLIIKMSIPNLAPDSLDVSLVKNELIIKGKQKNGRSHAHRQMVQQQTFFSRTALPCTVNEDDITAIYRDKVLVITLPKKDPNQPKKILVNIAS